MRNEILDRIMSCLKEDDDTGDIVSSLASLIASLMMANDVEGYEMHSCGKKINVTIEDDKENIKWQ